MNVKSEHRIVRSQVVRMTFDLTPDELVSAVTQLQNAIGSYSGHMANEVLLQFRVALRIWQDAQAGEVEEQRGQCEQGERTP